MRAQFRPNVLAFFSSSGLLVAVKRSCTDVDIRFRNELCLTKNPPVCEVVEQRVCGD